MSSPPPAAGGPAPAASRGPRKGFRPQQYRERDFNAMTEEEVAEMKEMLKRKTEGHDGPEKGSLADFRKRLDTDLQRASRPIYFSTKKAIHKSFCAFLVANANNKARRPGVFIPTDLIAEYIFPYCMNHKFVGTVVSKPTRHEEYSNAPESFLRDLVSSFKGKGTDPLYGTVVLEVAAGYDHAIIRTTDGLYASGSNSYGECGSGGMSPSPRPTKVGFFTLQHDTGEMRLKARVAAGMAAFGNAHATLGSTPADCYTAGLYAAGLLDGGTGEGEEDFEPPPGTPAAATGGPAPDKATPEEAPFVDTISGGEFGFEEAAGYEGGIQHDMGSPERNESGLPYNITHIAAGTYFSLVGCEHGYIFAFGSNNSGKLGLDSLYGPFPSPRPVASPARRAIQQLVCGHHHAGLVCRESGLWLWGSNRYGQLGMEGNKDRRVPTHNPFFLPGSILKVSMGIAQTVVATRGEGVYVMGRNEMGQLGIPGEMMNTPVRLPMDTLPVQPPTPRHSPDAYEVRSLLKSRQYKPMSDVWAGANYTAYRRGGTVYVVSGHTVTALTGTELAHMVYEANRLKFESSADCPYSYPPTTEVTFRQVSGCADRMLFHLSDGTFVATRVQPGCVPLSWRSEPYTTNLVSGSCSHVAFTSSVRYPTRTIDGYHADPEVTETQQLLCSSFCRKALSRKSSGQQPREEGKGR